MITLSRFWRNFWGISSECNNGIFSNNYNEENEPKSCVSHFTRKLKTHFGLIWSATLPHARAFKATPYEKCFCFFWPKFLTNFRDFHKSEKKFPKICWPPLQFSWSLTSQPPGLLKGLMYKCFRAKSIEKK